MRQTVLLAVIEPVSFSLSGSVAWALASDIKGGTKPTVKVRNEKSARVCGVLPILQPIPVLFQGGSANIVFIRANIEGHAKELTKGDTGTVLLSNESIDFSITGDSKGRTVGRICWGICYATEPAFSINEMKKLRLFIDYTEGQLWGNVPINWTSHRYHMTDEGRFLTFNEISALNLSMGALSLLDGSSQFVGTSSALRAPWTAKWSAGKVASRDHRRLAIAIDAAATSDLGQPKSITVASASAGAGSCSSTSSTYTTSANTGDTGDTGDTGNTDDTGGSGSSGGY